MRSVNGAASRGAIPGDSPIATAPAGSRWCVAIDQGRMCCSIYEQRPAICRKFEMGGPYCREVRADYADRNARGIPLVFY